MATNPDNVNVYYLDSLTIDGVSFAGALDEESARIVVEEETLDIKGSNFHGTIESFSIGMAARLELKPLESILVLLEKVLSQTAGTIRRPRYALSGTCKDADGVEVLVTGTVQFSRNLTLELTMKQPSTLPIVANFRPVGTTLVTIGTTVISIV